MRDPNRCSKEKGLLTKSDSDLMQGIIRLSCSEADFLVSNLSVDMTLTPLYAE
jgi:hypothetical protein